MSARRGISIVSTGGVHLKEWPPGKADESLTDQKSVESRPEPVFRLARLLSAPVAAWLITGDRDHTSRSLRAALCNCRGRSRWHSNNKHTDAEFVVRVHFEPFQRLAQRGPRGALASGTAINLRHQNGAPRSS